MVLFAPGSITETVYDIIASHDAHLASRFQVSLRLSPLYSPVRNELCVLNSYWHDQLSALQYNLGINTLQIREQLNPSMDVQSWVNVFHRYVLPLILQYKIPR